MPRSYSGTVILKRISIRRPKVERRTSRVRKSSAFRTNDNTYAFDELVVKRRGYGNGIGKRGCREVSGVGEVHARGEGDAVEGFGPPVVGWDA